MGIAEQPIRHCCLYVYKINMIKQAGQTNAALQYFALWIATLINLNINRFYNRVCLIFFQNNLFIKAAPWDDINFRF